MWYGIYTHLHTHRCLFLFWVFFGVCCFLFVFLTVYLCYSKTFDITESEKHKLLNKATLFLIYLCEIIDKQINLTNSVCFVSTVMFQAWTDFSAKPSTTVHLCSH